MDILLVAITRILLFKYSDILFEKSTQICLIAMNEALSRCGREGKLFPKIFLWTKVRHVLGFK